MGCLARHRMESGTNKGTRDTGRAAAFPRVAEGDSTQTWEVVRRSLPREGQSACRRCQAIEGPELSFPRSCLEGTLRKSYPCFCDVPKEIEREAHRQWRSWLEEHTIGRLHLAKLVEEPDGLILPVDIPEWLMPRRKEILEYLAETAKSSFPTPGYPEPLIRAHEGAVLHGMEMAVLEDMFIEELLRNQPGNDADKTFEHVAIGRGLLKGGWKEYG